MILLLSPYQNAPECAAQIERATRDTVKTVNTIRLALAALRAQEFAMLVADENLLESTPGSTESLVQRMEAATPFILDLACIRPEKVGKLVLATSKRRELEFEMARERALAELRSELKSDLTGLLISTELALKSAGLSVSTSEKLNLILELAQQMHARLNPQT